MSLADAAEVWTSLKSAEQDRAAKITTSTYSCYHSMHTMWRNPKSCVLRLFVGTTVWLESYCTGEGFSKSCAGNLVSTHMFAWKFGFIWSVTGFMDLWDLVPVQPPVDVSTQDTMMAVLVEMGFGDRSLNQRLLNKYNYNLLDVVNELVQMTDNDWYSTRYWWERETMKSRKMEWERDETQEG